MPRALFRRFRFTLPLTLPQADPLPLHNHPFAPAPLPRYQCHISRSFAKMALRRMARSGGRSGQLARELGHWCGTSTRTQRTHDLCWQRGLSCSTGGCVAKPRSYHHPNSSLYFVWSKVVVRASISYGRLNKAGPEVHIT